MSKYERVGAMIVDPDFARRQQLAETLSRVGVRRLYLPLADLSSYAQSRREITPRKIDVAFIAAAPDERSRSRAEDAMSWLYRQCLCRDAYGPNACGSLDPDPTKIVTVGVSNDPAAAEEYGSYHIDRHHSGALTLHETTPQAVETVLAHVTSLKPAAN